MILSDNLKSCDFAGMMNFADVVRKGFSKSECVQQINDQAATELSRHLTQSEIAALTRSFTPAQLMIGIRKVYSKILYKKKASTNSVWIWVSEVSTFSLQ